MVMVALGEVVVVVRVVVMAGNTTHAVRMGGVDGAGILTICSIGVVLARVALRDAGVRVGVGGPATVLSKRRR